MNEILTEFLPEIRRFLVFAALPFSVFFCRQVLSIGC